MIGLSHEEIMLEMYRDRSQEMRRHAAEVRLAHSAARTRHGTGRSWLRRRSSAGPAE
ncbi:hypothetical protein ACFFWC_11510 [Plantactinospora siamensis]|uniref:Uncharacterized protein n=1 Tax=Plantactinospora siamensis TaxID=555372 RepID=A0ABV6NZZ1_9ACTN